MGSRKKVWWKCPYCELETYQSPSSKVRKQPDGLYRFAGCIKHHGPRSIITGALKTISSTECLSRIWDSANPPALDPDSLFINSKVRAHWVCPKCGHRWCTPVYRAYDSSGRCPACEGRNIIVPGSTDLLTLAPDARRYYAWDKNADIDIERLGVASNTEVWWRCPDCGHESKLPIRNKIKKLADGSYHVGGCAKCKGKIRNEQDNYRPRVISENANMMKFWDWDSNEGLDPAALSVHSRKVVSWKCQKCGSTWRSPIKNMRNTRGKCPCCEKRHVTESENMMKFWSQDDNNGIDPATLNIYSQKVVTWRCQKCGYAWKAEVKSMSKFAGNCPCCNHHRVVVPGVNDVFSLVPEAKKYYDYEKNADIDITKISVSTKQRVWWKCPTCGNETYGSLAGKIRKIEGKYHFGKCKKCYQNNGNIQKEKDTKDYTDLGVHSLAAQFPNIALLWSANNKRPATTVMPDATFDALWVCPVCNYEYHSIIHDMVNGNAFCPVCTNKRIQPGFNTLADKNPDIAKLWSANNHLHPTDVFPTSSSSARWSCPNCGGEYNAPIRDVVSGIAECPYCAGRRPLSGHNTLADKYPTLAALWSADNDRDADSILPDSSFEALWVCPDCGGKYDAAVRDVVSGSTECPYCAGRRPLSGYNTLSDKYPSLAAMWAVDNDRRADSVLPDSPYEARWVCSDCGGKFDAPVRDMVNCTTKCPYCADKKALPGFNSFAAKHPDLLEEWNYIHNYAIDINPDTILDSNSNGAWWICMYGHKYKMSVRKRLMFEKRKKVACPICKGRRREVRHFI